MINFSIVNKKLNFKTHLLGGTSNPIDISKLVIDNLDVSENNYLLIKNQFIENPNAIHKDEFITIDQSLENYNKINSISTIQSNETIISYLNNKTSSSAPAAATSIISTTSSIPVAATTSSIPVTAPTPSPDITNLVSDPVTPLTAQNQPENEEKCVITCTPWRDPTDDEMNTAGIVQENVNFYKTNVLGGKGTLLTKPMGCNIKNDDRPWTVKRSKNEKKYEANKFCRQECKEDEDKCIPISQSGGSYANKENFTLGVLKDIEDSGINNSLIAEYLSILNDFEWGDDYLTISEVKFKIPETYDEWYSRQTDAVRDYLKINSFVPIALIRIVNLLRKNYQFYNSDLKIEDKVADKETGVKYDSQREIVDLEALQQQIKESHMRFRLHIQEFFGTLGINPGIELQISQLGGFIENLAINEEQLKGGMLPLLVPFSIASKVPQFTDDIEMKLKNIISVLESKGLKLVNDSKEKIFSSVSKVKKQEQQLKKLANILEKIAKDPTSTKVVSMKEILDYDNKLEKGHLRAIDVAKTITELSIGK